MDIVKVIVTMDIMKMHIKFANNVILRAKRIKIYITFIK